MSKATDHQSNSPPVLEYRARVDDRFRLPARTIGAIGLSIVATALALIAAKMRPGTSNSRWYLWQWDRYIWIIRLSRIALLLQLYAVVCAFIGSKSDRTWISGCLFSLGIVWLLLLSALVSAVG